MTTVSMKLPEHLVDLLEKESRTLGTTKSQIIRDCLETRLLAPSSKPNCFDLAKDLAGSAKKLPRDLSTNPKYMKDFGR